VLLKGVKVVVIFLQVNQRKTNHIVQNVIELVAGYGKAIDIKNYKGLYLLY